jgi:hypothetical protein
MRSASRAIAAANESRPAGQRPLFRIGSNVGDVMVKDGDIFGDGVNVAARLETLAEPGGICFSRGLRDHVRKMGRYVFQDLGEAQRQEHRQPIRAFRERFTPQEPGDAPPTLTPPRRTAISSPSSLLSGIRVRGLSRTISGWRLIGGRHADQPTLKDHVGQVRSCGAREFGSDKRPRHGGHLVETHFQADIQAVQRIDVVPSGPLWQVPLACWLCRPVQYSELDEGPELKVDGAVFGGCLWPASFVVNRNDSLA